MDATIKHMMFENENYRKYLVDINTGDRTLENYKINIFKNQETNRLHTGSTIEVIKTESGFWNFKKTIELKEQDTIPSADKFLQRENNKYVYGMAAKVVTQAYLMNCRVVDLQKDEGMILKQIKEVFNIMLKSREDCLGGREHPSEENFRT